MTSPDWKHLLTVLAEPQSLAARSGLELAAFAIGIAIEAVCDAIEPAAARPGMIEREAA